MLCRLTWHSKEPVQRCLQPMTFLWLTFSSSFLLCFFFIWRFFLYTAAANANQTRVVFACSAIKRYKPLPMPFDRPLPRRGEADFLKSSHKGVCGGNYGVTGTPLTVQVQSVQTPGSSGNNVLKFSAVTATLSFMQFSNTKPNPWSCA